MFTAEELEALVLGARWVEGRQDGSLSRAAGLALAKIAAASPDELKQRIDEAGLWPVNNRWHETNAPLLATVREAMPPEKQDRQNVGQGKSGAVSVEHGGS